MADVSRGQLLLVGAFGLAVVLVVLVPVLNAAIYTGNLAAREPAVPDRAVAAHDAAAGDAVERLLGAANANDTATYAEKRAAVVDGVDDWGNGSARHAAVDGGVAHLRVTDTVRGSRIRDAEPATTLTNRSGAANWTLASGVSGTRAFRLSVSRTSLPTSCGLLTDCFTVVVDDGTDAWRVRLRQDAATLETVVRVRRPDGTVDTCRTTDDPAVVDLTAGTVGGEDCPALAFAEGVSAPYELRYVHGDAAVGTYGLVVDTPVSTAPHYESSGSPTVDPAVYAVEARLTDERGRLTYARTLRVAPGEPDA